MKYILMMLISLFLFSFQTQKQEEKLYNYKFTASEVQLIYDALGELPAKKVDVLRAKIVADFNKQNIDTTTKKKP